MIRGPTARKRKKERWGRYRAIYRHRKETEETYREGRKETWRERDGKLMKAHSDIGRPGEKRS